MGNKGKKNRVWVGFSQSEGFVSYSTKSGLAKRLGVSVGKLERAFDRRGDEGTANVGIVPVSRQDGKGWDVWWFDQAEVVRQEARGVAKGRPGRSKIGMQASKAGVTR